MTSALGEDLDIHGLTVERNGEKLNGLQLPCGTITVLIGANGSGKTSLMDKIAGLRAAEGVEVRYGQAPLWLVSGRGRVLNETALRAYAYAGQSAEDQLTMRSVRDELVRTLKPYPLNQEDKEARMLNALTAVGFDAGWMGRIPLQISGGERRRAALACALAAPTSWLFLDEPTAGLDAKAHELLSSSLSGCREAGQGIFLISHDTDWSLPLADQILVMRLDGSLRMCSKLDLLAHPEHLQEAGMAVPEWLQFAHAMYRSGVPAEAVWDPISLAGGLNGQRAECSVTEQAASLIPTAVTTLTQEAHSPNRHRVDTQSSPLTAFDPKSVWAGYVLMSAGIMLQGKWSGIAIGALATVLVLVIGRIPLARWRAPIQSITLFTLITAVFAGLQFSNSAVSWDWSSFTGTIRSLTKPWLAMLIGFGLPLIITPLRLRKSLEQLLAYKGRLSRWAQNLILIVTLLLRFVPVFIAEWERFDKLAAARGKQSRLTWRQAPGRIRDTALPFMLALFRVAEDAAAALESRGVGRRPYPIIRKTQRWQRRDYVLACCSIVFFIGMWLWDRG
ncbi:energy-coupling factor transport system ATP-binding protein [Paenibacillus phyllosphaerae]|uniref:Energy-coupling factor transport system ATP-binding protein n=1 Tax=Paenibacillus phyllosphaerae TaxID=274593 RepID=A0A7W5B339_9BACL|nr:ATP-binding cassette domain-containing protein [Paenibacillus phyllosphaerae]MBB3113557.1 energy-coupling factor transport system ATP-binding protein [Paenibacillus phyllosphaerae]